MRGRASFWRRSREWPVPGQIAFALVIILIGTAAAGALNTAIHGTDTPTRSEERTPTATSRAPVSTTPIGLSTTVPSEPTAEPATVRPCLSALMPVTIAAPSHADTYNRAIDFGAFIDVDHDCQDTRAEVLIRTSTIPVTFTTSHHCTVKTGRWVDPWSGVATTIAHDFQIDHTVPLENAWISGAWAWTPAQRVAFANDLIDTDQLVPILSAENESKGDGGPDRWRPPDRAASCRYALDWDRIKAKWHLTATAQECAAIQAMDRNS